MAFKAAEWTCVCVLQAEGAAGADGGNLFVSTDEGEWMKF